MTHRKRRDFGGVHRQWQSIARKTKHIYCALFHYTDPVSALINCLGIKLSDQEIRYTLRNGMIFDVHRGGVDIRVINHIVCQNLYAPLSQFVIQDGWTVVDLGAHKGVFAVLAARQGSAVNVIAVEPEPTNFHYLGHNVKVNELANVELINSAVWTTDGEISLQLSPQSWGHYVARGELGSAGESVSVKATTLDSLLSKVEGRVDLLKMDIEGAEFDVFYGASPASLQRIQRIAVEYHENVSDSDASHTGEALAAFLTDRGFTCMFDQDAHEHIFAWRD